MTDLIAQALTQIKNAGSVGKDNCVIKPTSKLLRHVLDIMRLEGYIGEFEIIDNGRGGIIKVQLKGKINKCGAIKPRFAVGNDSLEKFEKRYLPAKDFGVLIMSTTKGVMTHFQAKKEKIGGRLLAYVY
ncbi:MAG TPA: 30S ribosomal protein S8 [Candidatus Woesearchaeota archaeon]|nr:30S ribosomal protein S8 [Candidatus Woesearchaeota archaeon]